MKKIYQNPNSTAAIILFLTSASLSVLYPWVIGGLVMWFFAINRTVNAKKEKESWSQVGFILTALTPLIWAIFISLAVILATS